MICKKQSESCESFIFNSRFLVLNVVWCCCLNSLTSAALFSRIYSSRLLPKIVPSTASSYSRNLHQKNFHGYLFTFIKCSLTIKVCWFQLSWISIASRKVFEKRSKASQRYSKINNLWVNILATLSLYVWCSCARGMLFAKRISSSSLLKSICIIPSWCEKKRKSIYVEGNADHRDDDGIELKVEIYRSFTTKKLYEASASRIILHSALNKVNITVYTLFLVCYQFTLWIHSWDIKNY